MKEEFSCSVTRTKGRSVLLQCQCSDLAVLLAWSLHPFSASYGMQQTAPLFLQCPLALLHQAEAQVAQSLQHLAESILEKHVTMTADKKALITLMLVAVLD